MTLRISLIAIVAAVWLQPVSAAEVTLRGSADFDLETGYSLSLGDRPYTTYDLVFGCGPQGHEFLRALNNTAWVRSQDDDFRVGPDVLKAATYTAPTHSATGYPDLFRALRQFVPQPGTVYYVRTGGGNFAKVRISGYQSVAAHPSVCRDLRIEYVLYHALNTVASADFAPVFAGYQFVREDGTPYAGWLCVGDSPAMIVTVTDPDGVSSVKTYGGWLAPPNQGYSGPVNMSLIAPNTYRRTWRIDHPGSWGITVEAADPAGNTRLARLSMGINTTQNGKICGRYGEFTYAPRP